MSDDSRRTGDDRDGVESMSATYDDEAATRDRSGVLPDSRVERWVTVALVVVLLIAVGGVVYLAVAPPETTDPYTEFYVLGPDGNASGYPTNLTVDERGTFRVGLRNHEHGTQQYAVTAELDARTVFEETMTVENEASWGTNVSFTPETPGEKRLRLSLYTDGETAGAPDQTLRLLVSVRPDVNGTRPALAHDRLTTLSQPAG